MSMLCSLYRITPERVTTLKAFPDDVGELVGFKAPPPKIGLLSKLFGKSRNRLRLQSGGLNLSVKPTRSNSIKRGTSCTSCFLATTEKAHGQVVFSYQAARKLAPTKAMDPSVF